MLLSLILSFATSLWAQTESPESNHDLRRGKVIVSVEKAKEKESYQLEGMNSGDFYLSVGRGSTAETKKISRTQAEGLEQSFASMMFKLQYELPEDPSGCVPSWILFMHGEKLSICEKSDQKNQEIKEFLTSLKALK